MGVQGRTGGFGRTEPPYVCLPGSLGEAVIETGRTPAREGVTNPYLALPQAAWLLASQGKIGLGLGRDPLLRLGFSGTSSLCVKRDVLSWPLWTHPSFSVLTEHETASCSARPENTRRCRAGLLEPGHRGPGTYQIGRRRGARAHQPRFTVDDLEPGGQETGTHRGPCWMARGVSTSEACC